MRYWVIAPSDFSKKDIWGKVWEFDLSNNTIAIGWNKLGNISSYNEEKLREVIQEKYPDKNKAWKTWTFNSMWNFWYNIKVGDKNSALEEYKVLKTLDKDLANELFNLIYE